MPLRTNSMARPARCRCSVSRALMRGGEGSVNAHPGLLERVIELLRSPFGALRIYSYAKQSHFQSGLAMRSKSALQRRSS